MGRLATTWALAAAAIGSGVMTTGSVTAGEVAGGNVELQLKLSFVGRYDSGIRGASGAEIVQHDPGTQRLFTINAKAASVDVLDAANPSGLSKIATLAEIGGDANSVAIHEGLVAVAFAANPKTNPGKVVFYNAQTLTRLAEFEVGSLPDMAKFMPDGSALLVANEAEPNVGYTIDPEGSVTVIDLRGVTDRLDAASLQNEGVVHTAGFGAFENQISNLRASGVRIYGPGAGVAKDLEPEYIAVAQDGLSAWVTLQEANAVGVLDLSDLGAPYFSRILPLGTKDHRLPGNALDAGDRDGPGNAPKINIANWPVKGLYQPDAVASYSVKGQTYYVLANEGDDRNDFIPGEETKRVSALALDAAIFGDAAAIAALKSSAQLGRLTVTPMQVPQNAIGQYKELHVLGGRSFSIRNAEGDLLFDSGEDFERITAARFPAYFNASNDNNNLDDRSDNKGPEPEGVTVGKIRGRTFAFIALERIGGVMVYDVTVPEAARFVDYVNVRDFTKPPAGVDTNDAGPEGIAFISADDSPTGKPLVVTGSEVSGTTTVYAVNVVGK